MINKYSYDGNNNFETLQNALKDLMGEIAAVIEYDEHIHTTQNMVARQNWVNIRNDELTHIGNLMGLIKYLSSDQAQHVEKGFREFEEIVRK